MLYPNTFQAKAITETFVEEHGDDKTGYFESHFSKMITKNKKGNCIHDTNEENEEEDSNYAFNFKDPSRNLYSDQVTARSYRSDQLFLI